MDVTAYELISHLCCLHNQRKMNKLNLEMLFALFYWFCGRTKKKKKNDHPTNCAPTPHKSICNYVSLSFTKAIK